MPNTNYNDYLDRDTTYDKAVYEEEEEDWWEGDA